MCVIKAQDYNVKIHTSLHELRVSQRQELSVPQSSHHLLFFEFTALGPRSLSLLLFLIWAQDEENSKEKRRHWKTKETVIHRKLTGSPFLGLGLRLVETQVLSG